jgi:hypothetical protein
MKPGGLTGREVPLLPKHVGACQSRVAAEIDLNGRGEPPEIKAVGAGNQERRFRQVHLPSHLLHPEVASGGRKETDSCGVAGERLVGERVHLGETLAALHGINASASISTSISDEIRRLTSTMLVAGRTL